MSEVAAGNPNAPRWSFAWGCLSGILCGIAGAAFGGYYGFRLDDESYAARRIGRQHIADDWVPQWTVFWIVANGVVAWAIGWALTALLPHKRRKTLVDYLAIVIFGLLPALLLAILLSHW
jgi:hypothetical protein